MTLPDYRWSKEEAVRFKALWDGSADQHTQRMAVRHLVEIVCGINRIPFDPDNTHMTAFNSGRQWVGRQIQNAVTIPLDKLVKEEPNEPHADRAVPTASDRVAARAIAIAKQRAGRAR